MKMKIAWSKNLEMKQREDKIEEFQESDQNDQNNYQEYRGGIKKVKRYRSAFTTEQVHCLEKEFQKHPYIGNLRRKDVASVLNIPERAVKIWFQNRRMKEKKDTIARETADRQTEANTDAIDELLTKSASVTNESSLSLLRINETKQDDNEVSDLSIKKASPVLVRTDKDNTMMEFLKLNHSIGNTSTSSSAETSSEIAFLRRNKNQCDVKIKSETNNAQVLQTSPEPHIFKHQSDLISSSSTSNVPQDLSTFASNAAFDRLSHKPVQDLYTQKHVHSGLNMNAPLYLKGYYAQPYIPPGNMIWKPISVAPVMSTGLPATSMVNSSMQHPSVSSRSCTCNCHLKPYSNPMVLQQSPNPPVQYVITAVPLQNHTHKF